MKPAISVENLGKCYQVSHQAGPRGYRTMRESLTHLAAAPLRRLRNVGIDGATSEEFWALKGITFSVMPGEILGIIGRNGAGKSTLLKVLSRITKPSTGQVEIRGRIGSLLEVGTGFHPELSGRDNIFLNGSILGMRRAEVARRFDEIVAFAEIAKFLDMPVKRYSSGMYVRLAFAVAAHLDTEILVVDEVLAVGDAAFQNRCLNKMGEVSRSGRTVLFVSHNLASLRTLCKTAMVLESGRLTRAGDAADQIALYLADLSATSSESLVDRRDREGTGECILSGLSLTDEFENSASQFLSGTALNLVLRYQCRASARPRVAALSFWSAEGTKLFHVDNVSSGFRWLPSKGQGELACRIPKLPLVPGRYYINCALTTDNGLSDHLFSAATFDVLPGDYHGSGSPTPAQGTMVFVDHYWESRGGG